MLMKKTMSVESPKTTDAIDMRDLFSVQLQRLAGLSSRIAAMTIPQHFAITVLEWRTLAILDYLSQATLVRIARHAGVLKSQMSRTITQLTARHLIERHPNPQDGRSALLSLTAEGKALVVRILDDSSERNKRMLNGLSEQEMSTLRGLMQRVFNNSLTYYQDLKQSHPYELEGDDML
jgi:DNA-binding MarR family transcriptional regulator